MKEESSKVNFKHVTKAIFEKRGICNPSASPRCGICYPYGKPMIEDIRRYNSEYHSGNPEAIDNLTEATKKHYDGIIEIIEQQSIEELPLAPLTSEKKYVRRLLRWIWSYI